MLLVSVVSIYRIEYACVTNIIVAPFIAALVKSKLSTQKKKGRFWMGALLITSVHFHLLTWARVFLVQNTCSTLMDRFVFISSPAHNLKISSDPEVRFSLSLLQYLTSAIHLLVKSPQFLCSILFDFNFSLTCTRTNNHRSHLPLNALCSVLFHSLCHVCHHSNIYH